MIYLILHKVRGEPTLDVAEPLKIGEENAWIIPTSGHRAFPLYSWPIEVLQDVRTGDVPYAYLDGKLPDDMPDHYPATDRLKAKPKLTVVQTQRITKIDLDDIFGSGT